MGAMSDVAKVGAVVIIVMVILVGLGQLVNGSLLPRGNTYYVLVRFDDGTGLRPGMPLKLAGTDAGWVEKIRLTTEPGEKQTCEAKMRIRKTIHLSPDAQFMIGQEGLIGEKFLGVTPGDVNSEQVPEGYIFPGTQQKDITALVDKASTLIESVDTLLSPDQLGGTMKDLSTSLSTSLDKVNGLLDKAGRVVDSSQGYVVASLKNVHAMSANFLAMSQNLEQASVVIGKLAGDPKYADTIQQVTQNLNSVSANLSHLSGQLDVLISDPQVQQDAKDSVRLTKETLTEAKATLSRFQKSMDKADGLIDSATGVMDNANGLITDVGGAVGDARVKMDQLTNIGSKIDTKASLSVRAVDKNGDNHLGGSDTYVGDINVAAGYGKTFLSAGADNIGEDNNWNFLLGYGSLSGLSFRGGVYRGELGLGAAYQTKKGAGAEVMAYDTQGPKVNAYGYIPAGKAVRVIVGVEDATEDPKGTIGIGVDLK